MLMVSSDSDVVFLASPFCGLHHFLASTYGGLHFISWPVFASCMAFKMFQIDTDD
jgi:hypothetical protein